MQENRKVLLFCCPMKALEKQIFEIRNETDFASVALQIFKYQYRYNQIYHNFVNALGIYPRDVTSIADIPCMPVEFFKTHEVKTGDFYPGIVFHSSGTGAGHISKHVIKDESLYRKSLLQAFSYFYGNPADYAVHALLPSYIERGNASLVYMAKSLMEQNPDFTGDFFLGHSKALKQSISKAVNLGLQPLLIGVSFALLDLAEIPDFDLKNTIVLETGGMKGRRKEIIRDELHNIIREALHPKEIHSEYGMTELLSQAYKTNSDVFKTPPWMKVLIRDIHDPRQYLSHNQQGLINVIDLANIHSCAFLETKDLGKSTKEGFVVSGRLDFSDIRGCNLLL